MIQCTFSIAQLHLSVNSRAPTSMLRQSAFQPEAEPEPEFVMVAAPLWVDDLSTPWMVNGYNIDRGVDMMPGFLRRQYPLDVPPPDIELQANLPAAPAELPPLPVPPLSAAPAARGTARRWGMHRFFIKNVRFPSACCNFLILECPPLFVSVQCCQKKYANIIEQWMTISSMSIIIITSIGSIIVIFTIIIVTVHHFE